MTVILAVFEFCDVGLFCCMTLHIFCKKMSLLTATAPGTLEELSTKHFLLLFIELMLNYVKQ